MEKVTHVIDCGANSGTIYDVKKGEVKTISHADVLNLPSVLPRGSFVVSEYSHLGCERTEFSLSQPYTRTLLLDLYDRFEKAGIKLRLFPQQSTPRAISYSEHPKSDDYDPISIYNLIKDYPEISLMKPPTSFDPTEKRKQSWHIKKRVDADINRARREEPKYTTDFVSRFIRENIEQIEDGLSDDAKEAFGFRAYDPKKKVVESTSYKVGKDAGKINFNKIKVQGLYALAVCYLDPTTESLRVRVSNGEEIPISLSYAKRYIIRQSPFHFRGGICRSNMYYHGMKNYIINKGKQVGVNLKGKSRGGFMDEDDNLKPRSRMTPEEEQLYLKERRLYCKLMKEVQHKVIAVYNSRVQHVMAK